jgi:hypothetical protein
MDTTSILSMFIIALIIAGSGAYTIYKKKKAGTETTTDVLQSSLSIIVAIAEECISVFQLGKLNVTEAEFTALLAKKILDEVNSQLGNILSFITDDEKLDFIQKYVLADNKITELIKGKLSGIANAANLVTSAMDNSKKDTVTATATDSTDDTGATEVVSNSTATVTTPTTDAKSTDMTGAINGYYSDSPTTDTSTK